MTQEASAGLGDNVLQDTAMHVREPEVTTGVSVGKTFVVNAQQVQHGGMQVMGVSSVFHSQDSMRVGLSVDDSTLHATPCHP